VVFFVCGSPKGLAEYDSALCHWPGLEEEACRLAKERLAKSTHFSSPSVASSAYEELLALEPYEQHIAFELGQAQGLLGDTTNAIDAYAYLLEVNPNHRDAQVAIVGKQLKQCQVLAADTRFVRERGRDGLTSIDRFGEYVSYQLPREDENEHLSVGYGPFEFGSHVWAGNDG
jgi:tetratricopeptide (TPR) repeat protein